MYLGSFGYAERMDKESMAMKVVISDVEGKVGLDGWWKRVL